MSNFKKSKTENERLTESSKIIEKYPNRIPIIIEKDKKSKIKDIDKNKFLVPNDMTLGQFMYVIRKRINLKASEAIFLFINNALPPTASIMGTIYENNKDKDGFLYIEYEGENTFG